MARSPRRNSQFRRRAFISACTAFIVGTSGLVSVVAPLRSSIVTEAELVDRYNEAVDRLDLDHAERLGRLTTVLYPGPNRSGEKMRRECERLRGWLTDGKSLKKLQNIDTRCFPQTRRGPGI